MSSPQEAPREPGESVASEPDDETLLRAHISGDPWAFSMLVRRYQSRLWLTAWAVLRDPDDAKDAVQDGLIRAFRKANTWRGDGTIAGWLHRIVNRVALDRATALSRRFGELPLEHAGVDSVGLPRSDDVAEAAAERVGLPHRDNVAEAAAERIVQAVVASLPPDQRECLVRIDLLGFSFSEVAADLGIPDGTVRSRRARGKKRLVTALSQAGLVGRGRNVRDTLGAAAPHQRRGGSTPRPAAVSDARGTDGLDSPEPGGTP